jgi:hypothetical protein
MGAPAFKEHIGVLMGTTISLVLAVSPDWEELDHRGAVSARVFPGTALACPYLTQNSIVRVRRLSSVTSDDEIGESSSVLSHSMRPSKRLRDSTQVEGGTSSVTTSSEEHLMTVEMDSSWMVSSGLLHPSTVSFVRLSGRRRN